MLEGILNLAKRVKNYFFGDNRKEFSRLNCELSLIKSQISSKHSDYDSLSEIEEDEIRKGFEDAHFEDIQTLYERKKEIMDKLSKELDSVIKELVDPSKEFKFKEKLSESLGKKRHEMPQIDSNNITDFVLYFNDKVGVKKVKRRLDQLKPSQDEINEDKVYNFVSNYLNDNDFVDEDNKPKTKYIISNDNYILDGHHRWAADLEMNTEETMVDCYRVNLPAKELIRQANALKMTKQLDIDDETFKKSVLTVAIAKINGQLTEEVEKSFKETIESLNPIFRQVKKRDGTIETKKYWVSPEIEIKKSIEPTPIVEEVEIPLTQVTTNTEEEIYKKYL